MCSNLSINVYLKFISTQKKNQKGKFYNKYFKFISLSEMPVLAVPHLVHTFTGKH